MLPDKSVDHPNSARDHLANERTFLAWIRTSLGIIAFGFVIERFALFIKQMSFVLGRAALPLRATPTSSIVGLSLVLFGTVLALLAFLQFQNARKRIDLGTYRTSSFLYILLTSAVLIAGIILMIYLSSV